MGPAKCAGIAFTSDYVWRGLEWTYDAVAHKVAQVVYCLATKAIRHISKGLLCQLFLVTHGIAQPCFHGLLRILGNEVGESHPVLYKDTMLVP